MDAQHLDWYVVRATGLVAWGLASACVLHGLLHSSRGRVRRPRASWVLDVHSFLGALTCLASVVHVAALLFDRFVGFTLTDLLVPYATRYEPGALTWGIVALDLLLVVELTSLIRSRLSRRVWHATHLLAFAVFVAASVHGLRAGTDRNAAATRAFACVAIASVALATVARVALALRRPARRPVVVRHDAPTLAGVDAAIEEVVRGAARRRRVARHGHHRVGVSRGTPR